MDDNVQSLVEEYLNRYSEIIGKVFFERKREFLLETECKEIRTVNAKRDYLRRDKSQLPRVIKSFS